MFAGQPEPVPVSAEEALCALLRADYSAAPALASLRKATAATDETAGKGVFGCDFSLDLLRIVTVLDRRPGFLGSEARPRPLAGRRAPHFPRRDSEMRQELPPVRNLD